MVYIREKTYWSLLVVFIITLLSSGCRKVQDPPASIQVYYFFNNPCASCDEREKISSLLQEANHDEDKKIDYQFYDYNLFHKGNEEIFDRICKEQGINRKTIDLPLLIIGDQYVYGWSHIQESAAEMLQASQREVSEQGNQEVAEDELKFIYFYTNGCDDCDKVSKVLDQLGKVYPSNGIEYQVSIERKEVSKNYEEVSNYFEAYQVPEKEQVVPILFYAEGYLSGYYQVKDQLEDIILTGKAKGFQYPKQKLEIKTVTMKDMPWIIIVGILNGFNPCALSMLLLMLSLIITRKISVMKIGFLYILGRVIGYFALGTIFYSIFDFLTGQLFVKLKLGMNMVVVLLLLGLAIVSFLDFLHLRQGDYGKVKNRLSTGFRKFNKQMIEKATNKNTTDYISGLMVLAGVIVAGGEFLCTGQIYMATIVYWLNTSSGFNAAMMMNFMMYILSLMIPSIVIILIISKSKKIFEVSEIVRRNMPMIKLAYALYFLLMAVYIGYTIIVP